MKFIVEQKDLDVLFAYLQPILAPAQYDAINLKLGSILQKVVDMNEKEIPLDEGAE